MSPTRKSSRRVVVLVLCAAFWRALISYWAQGTLSGWSGEVVPPAQRKRLVGRLDALRSHVSELKEAAPQRDDDDDAR